MACPGRLFTEETEEHIFYFSELILLISVISSEISLLISVTSFVMAMWPNSVNSNHDSLIFRLKKIEIQDSNCAMFGSFFDFS